MGRIKGKLSHRHGVNSYSFSQAIKAPLIRFYRQLNGVVICTGIDLVKCIDVRIICTVSRPGNGLNSSLNNGALIYNNDLVVTEALQTVVYGKLSLRLRVKSYLVYLTCSRLTTNATFSDRIISWLQNGYCIIIIRPLYQNAISEPFEIWSGRRR